MSNKNVYINDYGRKVMTTGTEVPGIKYLQGNERRKILLEFGYQEDGESVMMNEKNEIITQKEADKLIVTVGKNKGLTVKEAREKDES